jgi:hypothetical protein
MTRSPGSSRSCPQHPSAATKLSDMVGFSRRISDPFSVTRPKAPPSQDIDFGEACPGVPRGLEHARPLAHLGQGTRCSPGRTVAPVDRDLGEAAPQSPWPMAFDLPSGFFGERQDERRRFTDHARPAAGPNCAGSQRPCWLPLKPPRLWWREEPSPTCSRSWRHSKTKVPPSRRERRRALG